jgi:pullulanase/glycogen debranching enzyme
VNYVEVHDGLTLWDKLKSSSYAGTDADKQKQGRQAASLVFLSQGMPFIQAGQEMLRTKNGNANSYSPPETATTTAAKLTWELATNSLKWNSAHTNKLNVDYYKGLIALRKAHPLFRMSSVADINKYFEWLPYYNSPNALGFMYKNTAADTSKLGDSWNRIAIGVNPNSTAATMNLPAGTWYVVVNDTAAGTTSLATVTNNKATVPAYSTVVLTDTRP